MGVCQANKYQQQQTKYTINQQQQTKYTIDQQQQQNITYEEIQDIRETLKNQKEKIIELNNNILEQQKITTESNKRLQEQEQITTELKKCKLEQEEQITKQNKIIHEKQEQITTLQNRFSDLEKFIYSSDSITPFSSQLSSISKKNEMDGQFELYKLVRVRKTSRKIIYCKNCLEILSQNLKSQFIDNFQIEQNNSSQENDGKSCQFPFHSNLKINQENTPGNKSKSENQDFLLQSNLHQYEISKQSQYNQEEQVERSSSNQNQ